MSFSMTTEQVRNGTKTVTRRLGWGNLQPGELLWAVEKAQGLRKGEKIKRIRMIRVVSIEAEPLEDLYEYPDAREEVAREGFPGMEPGEFLHLFCEYNGVTLNGWVNRIEFDYIDVRRSDERT